MKSGQFIRLFLILAIIILPLFLLTSDLMPLFAKGLLLTLGILTILWVISLLVKDASIIDIYWGLGFVIIAWFYAYLTGWEQLGFRNLLLLALITIWGLRLSIYLAVRNLGKGEDPRYVQMRRQGGPGWWWKSYFQVFLLQGVLLWIISSIYPLSFLTHTDFGGLDYLGTGLWATGFFFETVGDWQMMQFKKDPANKGKVMDQGLWRYSRHPNYFGDATLWWGFFCFALAHPQGIFYLFSPVLMTFLLLKISGVTLLEKDLKKSKPQYAEYIQKTSSFVPLPPKQ